MDKFNKDFDVTIVPSRDRLLDEFGKTTLKERYLHPGETSPQERFANVAKHFSSNEDMAQRIYNYMSKLWFMPSTPILSNGGSDKGMHIACFLSYIHDSIDGIVDGMAENAHLSVLGGGVANYWGAVRSVGMPTSKGNISGGIIPFIHEVDSQVLAFKQGRTRRGAIATYIDISHPEVDEYFKIRKPSGGDIHRLALNSHHGVCVPDKFMKLIEGKVKDASFNDDWELIDPHTKEVVKTVSASSLWETLLNTRAQHGEPYIYFTDTVYEALPQYQKDLGLSPKMSNLCTEITLPIDEERTAVCCLSSVNAATYDEWKNDPLFIADLVEFLDNVIEYFINNAPDTVSKAKYSASKERAIGIGLMGLHTYMQMRRVPFESAMSVGLNHSIFKNIKDKAYAATIELAKLRGPCPDSANSATPVRNSHLLAVAPNGTSSIICGNISPSVEPLRANSFIQKTSSGTFLKKNSMLEKRLEELGRNNDSVWESINTNEGSVQHLDFLTELDKDIFKTAEELDQRWIIELASVRQLYICQSQSTNIFVPDNVFIPYLHQIHFDAWKKKLKTLYYCRSKTSSRVNLDSIGSFKITTDNECLSCEG